MKTSIRKRLLSLFLALAMLAALTPAAVAVDGAESGDGAGIVQDGNSQDDGTQETVVPSSVSLSQTTMSLKVGENGTLTATLKDASGQEITTIPQGVKVEWTSTDPQEVSVTPASGSLTASVQALKTAETNDNIKEVSITVTVTRADGTALPPQTCNVLVSPNVPDGVSVTPNQIELAPEQKTTLTAAVTPDTLDQTVTWRSENTAIATVNEATGEVTAVAPGETKIIATSKANGLEAACTVTVQGIVLDDENVTINQRGSYTLKYTIYGEALKKSAIVWTSADTSIVTVDSGYLMGVSVGETTVTAKIEGYNFSDSCKVTVKSNNAQVIHASASVSAPLSFSSLT